MGSPSRTITDSRPAKNSGESLFSNLTDALAQARQHSGASAPNQSLRAPSSEYSIRCCAPVISQTLAPTKSLTSAYSWCLNRNSTTSPLRCAMLSATEISWYVAILSKAMTMTSAERRRKSSSALERPSAPL